MFAGIPRRNAAVSTPRNRRDALARRELMKRKKTVRAGIVTIISNGASFFVGALKKSAPAELPAENLASQMAFRYG
jgi:hypothetical protein